MPKIEKIRKRHLLKKREQKQEIERIEKALGKKAEKKLLPMQPGDVVETYADIRESQRELGFQPRTRIEEGIERFVDWYRSYYRVSAG